MNATTLISTALQAAPMPVGERIQQRLRQVRRRLAKAAPAPRACVELSLRRDQLHSVPNPQGREVRCLEGRLWLTFEHCPVDVFLDPGDSLHCGTHQGLVIEAIKPARCLIV
ncbi:MAG: DUF2917 domain-containing protein [Hydrogenophaga sp.]|uniref:DUF2917 domain-containing protein n=1 Tax=Hydrogenophaga sp. TaxID=1904254 RepID=UPI001D267D76|nr:DUF2917 domain-containing protein [Hydrogenophaga sp.]MBX3608700.1 DUF2917 domain-containing protein [Hydrogenophaga sp.]